MASIKALNEDIVETLDGFQASMTSLRAVARAEGSSLTRATLQHIDADLAAYQADIDEHRATLDSQQVVDALIVERGDLHLRAWRWERAVRRRLVLVRGAARTARVKVRDLTDGLAVKVHVVKSGETLQSIAQRHLGDWREWTRLLEANDLDPSAPLAVGTELIIPHKR